MEQLLRWFLLTNELCFRSNEWESLLKKGLLRQPLFFGGGPDIGFPKL
jgi:hypothetical protein